MSPQGGRFENGAVQMMIWRGTGTSGLVALLRLYAERDRSPAANGDSRPPPVSRPEPKGGRREG